MKKLAWVHRIGSVIEAEVLNRLITPNFLYLMLCIVLMLHNVSSIKAEKYG